MKKQKKTKVIRNNRLIEVYVSDVGEIIIIDNRTKLKVTIIDYLNSHWIIKAIQNRQDFLVNDYEVTEAIRLKIMPSRIKVDYILSRLNIWGKS